MEARKCFRENFEAAIDFRTQNQTPTAGNGWRELVNMPEVNKNRKIFTAVFE